MSPADRELAELAARVGPEGLAAALEGLPDHVVDVLLRSLGEGDQTWATPADLAGALDPRFVVLPHTRYLSDALAQATREAAQGHTRRLVVSMPPRSGKSTLCSEWFPLWLLAQRPFVRPTSLGLLSYSPALAAHWARTVRRAVEESGGLLGSIRPDMRSVTDWETTDGDGVRARSVGQNVIGLGFQVAMLDDVVKDAATAHSPARRAETWGWWTDTMSHRMEPGGSVVVVVGTRWHADDFIGRLLSREHEGDPDQWEQITFPALATRPGIVDLASPSSSSSSETCDDLTPLVGSPRHVAPQRATQRVSEPGGECEGGTEPWRDVIGRLEGEPLRSPLVPDETTDEALARWDEQRRTVGTYTFSAVFQQDPMPPGGLLLDGAGLRYWSRDPELVLREPDTVLLPDDRALAGGVWVDAWDTAQTEGEGDWTVGQRWVKVGEMRYLVDQVRGQWSFTGVLERIRAWCHGAGRYGEHVRKVLVEKASSGSGVIDVLNRPPDSAKVTPVVPRGSKTDRVLAVTPEWEAGEVVLPHPDEQGYAWSRETVAELLTFPSAPHDDTVDTLTMAQTWLSSGRRAAVSGTALTTARVSRGARGQARRGVGGVSAFG